MAMASIGIIERGQLLLHGPMDEVYRRIRRNRVIEVKFLSGQAAGLSIIRSRPELLDLQVDNSSAVFELKAEDDQVAGLLDELVGAGVKMRSFAEKDPSLEDVFMMVTKGLVT